MPKKLIEVALPLDAINRESAREKSIRHGHPSTLHLWWARRPLAACRAVLFASIVDDPDQEGVPEALLRRIDELPLPENRGESWTKLSLGEQRRERLFAFIEKLVKWENSNDERILTTARELIHSATDGNPPPVYDPFCGGGSIPLEAQRLGLEAHASDLNPVAVLITKALIEIPPKFANRPPVNPQDRAKGMGAAWKGAAGLAADVRYYGKWMRDEAEKRIGHLYPKVKLPPEQGGREATVIAWLWARTVKCPNPACGAQMPLIKSFCLSDKAGRRTWVEPIIDRRDSSIRFVIRQGSGDLPKETAGRRGVTCLVCGTTTQLTYVRSEGKAGGIGQQLIAMVVEGRDGRVYLPATDLHSPPNYPSYPAWDPQTPLPDKHRSITAQLYGLDQHGKLFTKRQLVALTVFSDLVGSVREQVRADYARAILYNRDPADTDSLSADSYADALATYLAFPTGRAADYWSSVATWYAGNQQIRCTFARQAISMAWDFAEANPFSNSSGGWSSLLETTVGALQGLGKGIPGNVSVANATSLTTNEARRPIISTDPPYYDNIGYSDLSDFFYVWLRRSMYPVYPDLFRTLLTPKTEELIASPHRLGGSVAAARDFFEEGLRRAFECMRTIQPTDYPLTVFYAFKQTEEELNQDALELLASSTGWETMLEGLLRAGLAITGTWPMHSEQHHRMIAHGANALVFSQSRID